MPGATTTLCSFIHCGAPPPPHLVSEGSPFGQSKSCKLQVGLECTQGLGESHLWADSDLVVATVLLDLSSGIVQKGGTWLQL